MGWEGILGKGRGGSKETPKHGNHPEGARNIPEGGNGVLGIQWRFGHCQENLGMIPQLCVGWAENSQGNLGVFRMEGATRSLPVSAQKVGNSRI